MADAITPNHYRNHPSGIEAITISRHMSHDLGAAFDYVWRAGQKDDYAQDLNKALWFIDDAAKHNDTRMRMASPIGIGEAIMRVVHHEPDHVRSHALSMLWFADTYPPSARAEVLTHAREAVSRMIKRGPLAVASVDNGGPQ